MSRTLLQNVVQRLHPKDDERNMFSATLHMFSITFISMSLVDVSWFSISGDVCVPYLTLGQFFWFGYTEDGLEYSDYDCINITIVNLMRITILLCFMAIIFATAGFLLDIIGPKSLIYRMLRRYAIAGICTILWVMTIVTISYYVIVLLKRSIESKYPKTDFSISYGLGFFLLTTAGFVETLNLLYTLLLPYKTNYEEDDQCLIDNFSDNMDRFDSPTPPPPYSLPPPPYTP